MEFVPQIRFFLENALILRFARQVVVLMKKKEVVQLNLQEEHARQMEEHGKLMRTAI